MQQTALNRKLFHASIDNRQIVKQAQGHRHSQTRYMDEPHGVQIWEDSSCNFKFQQIGEESKQLF